MIQGRLLIVTTIIITLAISSSIIFFHELIQQRFLWNVANILINQELWIDGRNGVERQKTIKFAASLVDSIGSIEKGDTLNSSPNCSMIPSLAIAEEFRRESNLAALSHWLHHAASVEALPVLQKSILLPESVGTSTNGNLVLNWESDWRLVTGTKELSEAASVDLDKTSQIMLISYKNTSERDSIYYGWFGVLPLSYWSSVKLKFHLKSGTFLTVESHTDEGFIRNVAYYQGDGEWEELVIPLQGSVLNQLTIAISEPEVAPTATTVYSIDLAPVQVVFDPKYGGCTS